MKSRSIVPALRSRGSLLLRAFIATAAVLMVSTRANATEPGTTSLQGPPSSSIALELAMSAGATALIAPAIYSTARFVGTSSGNAMTSMFPALFLALTLPPVVATAGVVYQRKRDGRPAGWVPTYLYAVGAQALVLLGAFAAKTWVADPKDLLLLSAATGAALGGASTLGAEIHF